MEVHHQAEKWVQFGGSFEPEIKLLVVFPSSFKAEEVSKMDVGSLNVLGHCGHDAMALTSPVTRPLYNPYVIRNFEAKKASQAFKSGDEVSTKYRALTVCHSCPFHDLLASYLGKS